MITSTFNSQAVVNINIYRYFNMAVKDNGRMLSLFNSNRPSTLASFDTQTNWRRWTLGVKQQQHPSIILDCHFKLTININTFFTLLQENYWFVSANDFLRSANFFFNGNRREISQCLLQMYLLSLFLTRGLMEKYFVVPGMLLHSSETQTLQNK